MPASDIIIKGAREHNLRDVDLVLPRNKLIVLTGVSGSGKSSLAFDTVYAEGQRRYVESLSSFARQFLGQMPKPDVDYIGGLSPSISISQKSTGVNPRSTVGTVTEIYDFLRVLYARVGDGHCPQCRRPITAQSREEIIARILQLPAETKFSVLAPLTRQQKGEHRDLFVDLLKQGFVRARVDGDVVQLSDDLALDRQMRHDIEVVVDRLVIKGDIRSRLAEAVETALKLGEGNLIVALEDAAAKPQLAPPVSDEEQPAEEEPKRGQKKRARSATRPGDLLFSSSYACTHCGLSFEPPSPQLFSFNSPQGYCPDCSGLGEQYSFDPDLVAPYPKLSFKQGAIELVGPWSEMGRWKRHIYQGTADTIERKKELKAGTMLETPWGELAPELKKLWLYGTGDEHITFTWRGGDRPMMYGGKFEGVIPDLMTKHRQTKSPVQLRQLEKYMSTVLCPTCHGERLSPQARAVTVQSLDPQFADSPARSLPEACHLSIRDAIAFLSELKLDGTRKQIAEEALKEIRTRLGFLLDVGLDYLTLDRPAPSLSGGESQRIRLASQIGSGLVGVLYILDEPSIGLHPRDNDRLLATLHRLRDMGNTVVVVEHDEETMWAADHLIDFGPGPGVRGGELVAAGTPAEVVKEKRSLTGKFLSGESKIEIPEKRRPPNPDKQLRILGAEQNNLKNVDVDIPLGCFVCVTGVSGSGKSSLVNDILVEALHRDLNKGEGDPGKFRALEGIEHLDKLIAIDQSPIGRTPRSNPGTYIKVFDDIRDLFCQMPEAKRRGFKPGRFSFNVEGGRCEACEGNGSNRLEMDFLADVWVTCPVCEGKRFSRETLAVKFKDKSIADVLEMDVQQALALFENIPQVRHKLQTLHDVGLDYIKLGQPSPTLSGGEAQRIKLARELVKKSTGKTLYLLDEPTTGLHFKDIQLLLKVLHDFVEAGNTVLVVEHNLDVIKTADWLIDLGPEGGGAGGEIIVCGTPEEVVRYAKGLGAGDWGLGEGKNATASPTKAKPKTQVSSAPAPSPQPPAPRSHTGESLIPVLDGTYAEVAREKAKKANAAGAARRGKKNLKEGYLATHITVKGAKQHNLKGVDVEVERGKMTVFCGPSGSGKSSLAMDTIYAEGQRRYVESLSAYARQFVAQMQKPAVDHIDGLSPAIAIEQKNLGHTPRSTVGTVTEIYDYLRILLARLGVQYCPTCNIEVGTQTVDQVVDKILALPTGTKLFIAAPIEIEVGQQYTTLWEQFRAAGYARVRIDGNTYSLEEVPDVDRRRKHKVEVVLDRTIVDPKSRARIAESVENALALGKGVMHVVLASDTLPEPKWETEVHSQHLSCKSCGRSFEPLTPHNFSFNSSLGWCPSCEGLGVQTGANPALLLNDPKLTLGEGALAIWPNVSLPIAKAMLEGLGRGTGVPLDQPFEQLASRHRRVILHGAGEQWFDVAAPNAKKNTPPLFRFQYKGLYPALEEASHLSPSFRMKLEHFVTEVDCSTCDGSRLREDAAAVRFRDRTMADLCRMPFGQFQREIENWNLSARDKKIAGELLREITGRVEFLNDVGLEYLSLSRPAATLSNGEAQRIRLAGQLGSGLCGVLYVLDEPTIGLHPRDNTKLLKALHRLRDLGNTLLVVEHDREVIDGCDSLVDFGPGAGKFGGTVVAAGTPAEIMKKNGSVTGPYLSGKKAIAVPITRRKGLGAGGWGLEEGKNLAVPSSVAKSAQPKSKSSKSAAAASASPSPQPPASSPAAPRLILRGARHNNLKNITVEIPLGTLTAITGPSGSGKSTLVEDVLHAAIARKLHRAALIPGAHDALDGLEHINKVIRVDQQPLGNSPTSNPATYTGLFDLIRELFARLPDAKLRGFTSRRFSFNVPGGRCEACEGAGQRKIEMHFLPDVWVECETCRGKRYNAETLDVKFHGKSVSEVLDMTCGEALQLFDNVPKIRRILQTLCDVGLDYLTLGQSAPTLSGGEAQRVKLAAELARPDTGRTLYLLDEPTTGLHFDDLAKLLEVLQRLVDLGNTVVVIEHNLDIIKSCDWIVDMGPEAGEGGGRVVASGTPEEVVAATVGQKPNAESGKPKKSSPSPQPPAPSPLRSYTAEALAPVLAAGPFADRNPYDPAAELTKRHGDVDINEVGKNFKMPWQADGRKWHTQDRVGRKGEPVKWDGRILERVVDRIQDIGGFAETDWSERSVVEITGEKKADGWFFHAITGETYLLKMKFRVNKGTFKRDELLEAIELKTLNEMNDLPIYGNEPRVKVKQQRGPWQEVELRVNTLEEIDTPAFWSFVDRAAEGFFAVMERATAKPEDISPWKVLGQKWHFLKKGFPPGKPPAWDLELLEELCQMLQDVNPQGQFLWNNQQVVHVFVPQQREPWASIWTKRPQSLVLTLTGPKGKFAFGQLLELGHDRELDDSGAKDVIKLQFTETEHLQAGDLTKFLKDHLGAIAR